MSDPPWVAKKANRTKMLLLRKVAQFQRPWLMQMNTLQNNESTHDFQGKLGRKLTSSWQIPGGSR